MSSTNPFDDGGTVNRYWVNDRVTDLLGGLGIDGRMTDDQVNELTHSLADLLDGAIEDADTNPREEEN